MMDSLSHSFSHINLAAPFGPSYINYFLDLKTENIFLTSKGVIKVGDFGIARFVQNTLDLAVTSVGTPLYLSPEVCDQKPYP